LFLILPPNFEEAAARGKVMLVLEASWAVGVRRLNALPRMQAFQFSDQDSQLLDRIEELAGETPAMLVIDTKAFAGLLPDLAEHPRVTLGRNMPVELSKAPFPLPLRGDAGIERRNCCQSAWEDRAARPHRWRMGLAGCQRLQPLGLPLALRGVLQAPVRVPRTQVPLFLSQFWPQLAAMGNVEATSSRMISRWNPSRRSSCLELQRRTGAARCAAPVRLRAAHHDRGRDE
jgi:hypothetical protein